MEVVLSELVSLKQWEMEKMENHYQRSGEPFGMI
jgi:hypothetical protein